VSAFAESIERDGGLRMRKRARIVELGERGLGRLQARAEHPALVGAAQALRPVGVRLVLEHLAAYQPQRLLKRAPSGPRRLASGALEQLVEPIEIEVDEIGREAIRLCLGDHELTRPLAVRSEVAAENGDECLERAGGVLWQLFSPKEVGEAIGRHTVPACGQQDLEHLLRAAAAEIPRAERPGILDRKRPEQPNLETLPMFDVFIHSHRPVGRSSSVS
jgi:hypothetical protein